MSFLFLFILIISVILLIFPTIFKFIFIYLFGFSKAQIKLKHPFKFVRTFLQLRDPIWGIQLITIFIPEISIFVDIRNFKLGVIIEKPRVMLTRSSNQLLSLKIVDGMKENNLLFNLVTILKSLKKNIKVSNHKQHVPQQKQNRQQTKFGLGIKAALQFIVLILVQSIDIKIKSAYVGIVSSLKRQQLQLQNGKDPRIQISLLQSFAEYLMVVKELNIGVNLVNDHQINLQFNCPFLKLFTSQHMEDILVKTQNLLVSVRIPFTFSFKKSMQKISVFITIPKLYSHSTPVDFQHLSKLINQILFEQEIFNENYIPKQPIQKVYQDINQLPHNKIILSIDQVQIKISHIAQQDQDTPQAYKYLSNIITAILKLDKVKLNQLGFMVNEASLSVKKYDKLKQQIFQNGNKQSFSKQVLKINNLFITKQDKVTRISHDDVKISCQRQELALLGKLFTLINSRVIINEYDQIMYLPYLQIVRSYVSGRKNLSQTLKQILTKKQQTYSPELKYNKSSTTNQAQQHQTSLIYSPKLIQFQLDISQLIHKIILYSSQYRQSRLLNGQINHEISFKKINMQYLTTKQFQVNDFKLFYKQNQVVNQLQLQIMDIHMIQNFYTLKDYFIGFTMFKLLLQFTSDLYEKQQLNKKSVKTRKKSLNFNKIIINYATEMLTLRKLSVTKQTLSDNKLSSLYFSLGKCDFSVQRLYQTNKIMKYYLNPSHDLLSVTSITIKQFVTANKNNDNNNISSNMGPKQKYMISIKNPIFLLPQIDISQRLINYVKTLNKLQPSLQIFMNNTTDQQIRAKRRKYKIFMIDPDIYMIKINNLTIGIQDSVLDRAMLNKMRFSRQYLQRKPKYNQSQTIKYLRQTAQKYNLLQIRFQNISIDVKPVYQAGNSQKSVKQWISQLKQQKGSTQIVSVSQQKSKIQQQQCLRLIKVNNINIQLDIHNFYIKIRDYPYQIINISKINSNLQYIKTKNIYQQTLHYIKNNINIDQFDIKIGLSLLSGIQQIYNKLIRYTKAMDQYKNTQQFLHTIKTKSNIELSSYKPYWHIMHKSADWYININKQSQINVNLLTGLNPYSKENLSLKLGPLGVKSNPTATSFSIEFLQLSGNKLKIFQVGRLCTILQTIYKEPDLNLIISLHIDSHSLPKNKKLKDNNFRISQQIIKQIWQIKQLRTDWLLIYGLVQPNSKKQQNVLKRQQQSSYIDLFRFAANIQLKNRDRQLSIFSVLKQVKIYAHIDKFCLQLADEQNQVDLVINNFNFQLITYTKQQQWKMRHFATNLQHIIGRLKIYRKKLLIHYDSNYHFLKLFNQITDYDIQNRNNRQQIFKQIFLVCRGIKLTFNQYAIVDNQVLYILKKIGIQSIKIQLTAELKKILDSLFVNIFLSNRNRVNKLTQNKYFKMSATQKLRETVVLVIRANRKKKKFCQKLKMYVIAKNIEVGFKTSKRLLLLTTGKPTCIKYNTSFIQQDLYHVDPKININFGFNDVQIWVNTHPNHLWVLGKKYSPSTLQDAERILKCSGIQFNLQKHEEDQILTSHYQQFILKNSIVRYTNLHVKVFQGTIELTRANIQVLNQIRQILISIVNTKQQKRKQWYNEKQKYSQMITNGRQSLKSKLSWKYSDVIKGPAPVLQSKLFITLDKINIKLLATQDKQVSISIDSKQQKDIKLGKNSSKYQKYKYPFMNLISSDIEIKIQVYTQQNLKKQFKINNLTILNCLEPEDSSYRVLFEMDHQNNLAILLMIQQCLLTATNHKILWNFYKNIHIYLYPIKLKLTQQLYNQIYYYFFGIKPETDQSQQQLSNILPDYYLSVLIDEIKVQAWHRTESRLKRLQGVNVKLQKFQLNNQFLDNKTLFDRWVKFLMKQFASQFFNVIGQKLFG